MRLYCLRSKFRSGYAVLEQEPVKVPPRDSSFLGRRRNVAATLPKEAQDSLTLELADEPFLPRKQARSEEHTSELQSLTNLVCRLLLEKKKNKSKTTNTQHNTM